MIIGIVIQKYFCNNLGVYALSYCSIDSVISYCKKKKTNIEVRIFSDNQNLVCEEVKKVFQYDNIKVLPIIEVRNISSYFQYMKNIFPCDIVLDTGLGDGFSDIYSNGKFLLQYFLKIIPEMIGSKTILLPQTLGPYKKSLFVKLAGQVIKKSTLCFARDDMSYSYANTISGNNNIILTTDMAMRLPKSGVNYSMPNGVNIGLNISGLLYMGGFTKSNQFNLLFNYSEFINKLIERILDKSFTVHLITHVYRNHGEGDEFACKALSDKFKGLILSPMFKSPMEAKAYISKMDFFIGSRMHSTIAAISSGVPVCPIGYSRKFNGLFETIGYINYVDATKETMTESLKKIDLFIDNRDRIKQDVRKAMKKADELGTIFYEKLVSLFEVIYREKVINYEDEI